MGHPRQNQGATIAVSLRRYAPVALILCGGVALTIWAFTVAQAWERDRVQVEFERRAASMAAALAKGLEGYVEMLHSVGSFIRASERVDRENFREFVTWLLARHPGIQVLEWIPRVTDAERAAYEAAARRDGYPHFQITERDATGRSVRAGRRREYFPAYYVEPQTGNERTLGFDLASNAPRREALERARDSGTAAASAPIRPVQETGDQPSFLVVVPIYRKGVPHETIPAGRANLQGFAVGVFRTGDIVETFLSGLDKDGLDVHLSDTSAEGGKRLLYNPDQARLRLGQAVQGLSDSTWGPHWSKTLNVAGRTWMLEVRSLPRESAGHRYWPEWGVLIGGLLLTTALGTYLLTAMGRAAKVDRLVVARTEELTGANKRLEGEIAERERAEAALSNVHSELEMRVQGRTAELVRANDALQSQIARQMRAEEALPRGTETLLLVEDNPMVLELGAIHLTELGYTVLTAGDGVEALPVFEVHPEIALVLTDAIMPRMGAAALIPALLALSPGVKILVVTGYAPAEVRATLDHLDIAGYLQKPFRQADLAPALRAALDNKPALVPVPC